jgi:hypothetical protein
MSNTAAGAVPSALESVAWVGGANVRMADIDQDSLNSLNSLDREKS